MRTLSLILCVVLLGAPLACLASKCMDDCAQFKIEVPPKPESGYNAGKAVASILDGILTAVRAKIAPFGERSNAFGYIGGGLFGGIWGAAVDAQEPAKMDEYNLAKGLQSTQDYLACVMEAQVSGAVYQLNERMDNDKINAFNGAIKAITDYMSDNCAAHNCLNATTVEPSQRNAAVGAACMTPYPVMVGSDCSNVTWNPLAPKLCNGYDATGAVMQGICGVDGLCYHTDVGFAGSIKAFTALKDQFLAKDAINGFNAFNSLRNPTAVVAYAKGALVYLSVLQELHLLGAASTSDAVASAFAQRAADWLTERVNYHTNVNVTLVTVQDANEANTYNQEPLAIRKSCKPGDVAQAEKWYGCSKVGSGFNANTNFCLIKPNVIKTHPQHLCMGVCNDDNQRNAAGYRSSRSPQFMTQRTMGSLHVSAANEMAADNRKLFENSGVYSIIASFKELAGKAMPDGSHNFYQSRFTPKFLCNAAQPKQLLKAGAAGVAPLTAWEDADNLSKGSVVVRGVVIGGDKMQPIKSAAPAPAPAKAKAGRRLLDA